MQAELLEDEAREAEAKTKKKGKAKKAKALEAANEKTLPLKPTSNPTPEAECSAVLANKPQQADTEASSLSPKAKQCPCKACDALQAGCSGYARCPSHTLPADLEPSRPQTAGSQHSQSPSCLGGSDTASDAGSALDGMTVADSDDGWEVISGKGRRRSMTGARKPAQPVTSDWSASAASTPVHTRSNSPGSVRNRTAAAQAGAAAVAGSLRSPGRILAVPITQGAGLTGSSARAMAPGPWGTVRQAKAAVEKEVRFKPPQKGVMLAGRSSHGRSFCQVFRHLNSCPVVPDTRLFWKVAMPVPVISSDGPLYLVGYQQPHDTSFSFFNARTDLSRM